MGAETVATIVKRSNFQELEQRENQRFDYTALPEYPLDFSKAHLGSVQSVILKNETTGEKERLIFSVSHNVFFAEVRRRYVYGMVDTDDGRFVQIEFNVMEDYFHFDSTYNRIVAYLRAPTFRHFSPST